MLFLAPIAGALNQQSLSGLAREPDGTDTEAERIREKAALVSGAAGGRGDGVGEGGGICVYMCLFLEASLCNKSVPVSRQVDRGPLCVEDPHPEGPCSRALREPVFLRS